MDYTQVTGGAIRELCRAGEFTGPTAGVAREYVQANLVILPQAWAADFERFCKLNPKPCPLIEVTESGCFEAKLTAPGSDLRTDLPAYRVYRNGELVDRCALIVRYWPDDSAAIVKSERLVAFLIGCSFTFEQALLDVGIPVRHIEVIRNVPMFRTNRECTPAGAFSGPLVVSMRPMTPEQAEVAARITERMPQAHGAPVHVGDPSALGIRDLNRPDYGDAVTIRSGEVPVFWACGVTPMEAIMRAKPPLAITHEPGHMFVTDLKYREMLLAASG
jgi:uncharacterized protein YcsI (UPF0317 family)